MTTVQIKSARQNLLKTEQDRSVLKLTAGTTVQPSETAYTTTARAKVADFSFKFDILHKRYSEFGLCTEILIFYPPKKVLTSPQGIWRPLIRDTVTHREGPNPSSSQLCPQKTLYFSLLSSKTGNILLAL